jgi:hypothetical protein
MEQPVRYVRWFEEIKIEDVPLVGARTPLWGKCNVNSLAKALESPMGLPD